MPLIRVVDFETCGLEPPAEVCEVGWSDYDTESKAVSMWESRLCRVPLVPPEVRAVHHITAADTQAAMPWDADEFADLALAQNVCAYAAHMADFEAQWLNAQNVPLICTYKVALRLWPDAPGHSNQCLRYHLEDKGLIGLDRALAQPPHRAGPDAYVTGHILKAVFAAGIVGKQMLQWTREPAMLPWCPIGEHRGKAWADVPGSFLDWMVHKARDMDPDLKWNAQRELERRRG